MPRRTALRRTGAVTRRCGREHSVRQRPPQRVDEPHLLRRRRSSGRAPDAPQVATATRRAHWIHVSAVSLPQRGRDAGAGLPGTGAPVSEKEAEGMTEEELAKVRRLAQGHRDGTDLSAAAQAASAVIATLDRERKRAESAERERDEARAMHRHAMECGGTHECPKCFARWRVNRADPVAYPPPHPFAKDTMSLLSEKSCSFCEPAPADALRPVGEYALAAAAESSLREATDLLRAVLPWSGGLADRIDTFLAKRGGGEGI